MQNTVNLLTTDYYLLSTGLDAICKKETKTKNETEARATKDKVFK
jgi:hypothetical protein